MPLSGRVLVAALSSVLEYVPMWMLHFSPGEAWHLLPNVRMGMLGGEIGPSLAEGLPGCPHSQLCLQQGLLFANRLESRLLPRASRHQELAQSTLKPQLVLLTSSAIKFTFLFLCVPFLFGPLFPFAYNVLSPSTFSQSFHYLIFVDLVHA